MTLVLHPRKMLTFLLCIIGFLLFMNCAGIIAKYCFQEDFIFGLVPLFDFNTERNIPTLYSAFALLLASILLFIISYLQKKSGKKYYDWIGLAGVFMFFAIDEIASIHEKLTVFFRTTFHTAGILYYAWVIPYAVIAVLMFFIYLKFLLHLPRKIMILFFVSGTIFICGAMGFELICACCLGTYGQDSVLYALLYTVEEFLEMLGVVIFIYTLNLFIVDTYKQLTLTLKNHD